MKKSTSSSRLSVTIPVKPHLKKFIAYQLKESNGQLHITSKHAVGAFLFSLIETGSGKPQKKEDYPCFVSFTIPVRDLYGGSFDGRYTGVEINDTNVGRANEFFEFLFNHSLFNRLDYLKERGEIVRKGGKLKSAILNFLQKFDIAEEEMSYETVKKRYYRHCEASDSLLDKALK